MLFKIPASLGIFSMTKLVATQTVGEFLFNGFEDHILNTGSILDRTVPDKFGYFYNVSIPNQNKCFLCFIILNFCCKQRHGKVLEK